LTTIWPLAVVTVLVGPGTYRPLYPVEGGARTEPVAAFYLDETPVTVADFAAFVATHPEWRRDRVSRLFADADYLSDWAGPDGPGALPVASPVTRVSWFAARAYCRERDARLPTEAEWELAAAGNAAGRMSEADMEQVLAWYGRPSSAGLPAVGSSPPNGWGAHDLHGVVWEWVEDFNAALVSVDNREQGGADTARFCGAGALSAADREDYAAFMRVAFRSALQAPSTTRNLGFRCATDLETP
jgi:sulfatase modifying factor 1